MKPIIVQCPCCGTELDIDRRTGQIVRTGPKPGEEEGLARFDSVVKDVQRKSAAPSSAFDNVTRSLKSREGKLDDVFKDAFDKVREQDDGSRPPNPLDWD